MKTNPVDTEITRIIDWLQTYPDFNTTFDVSAEGTGQLIDFQGTDTIEVIDYVRSGRKVTYRNDYVIQVSKPFLSLLQRTENANFLASFELWVEQQSVSDKVPRLSDYGRQRAWVDSQQFVENYGSDETAIYQVMLHIQYTRFLSV